MKINCAYDELVELSKLVPNPKNNNKHPKEQIERLAKIIDFQGQRSPVVVSNRSGFIVKGHGRLEAIKKLGWDKCAVDYQDYESEAQEYADMIADNQIATWAEFDTQMVLDELPELDIDTDMLGMVEIPEIETEESEVVEDEVPEEVETRCKRGDIWQLGEHRLMCGDSTSITDVEKLMDGQKADMVFTDPPYGVSYEGGLNEKKKKQIKNDSLTGNDLYEMLCGAFSNIKLSTKERSAIYIFYATKTTREFINALYDAGLKQRGIIAWHKTGGGFGDFMAHYMNAYEPCIYASNGDSVNWYGSTDEKTVWDIDKEKKCDLHPTMKPIAVVSRAVKNSSKEKDGVLDLFGGSGSTLIACEQLNRKCFMMELDEHYCDVILQRYINFKGSDADVFLLKDGKKIPYSEANS